MDAPVLAGFKPTQSGVAYTVLVSDPSASHLAWTRQYSGSGEVLKFSSDQSGKVIGENRQVVALPVFVYSSTLLGQPPGTLSPGATWTNTIRHPTSTEYWTTTVAEVNPATGMVRLHISFQGSGEAGFAGGKGSQDQREDGEALFVHGIMTRLSLAGRETTTYPDRRRITNAVAIETRLEDVGSP